MADLQVPPRTALVLGGGGLKGFAHIGVIRALEERNVRPHVVAGTSIGALIAAAYAGGMSVPEMTDRAIALRRRDLFRINHLGMLLERMHCPSLYLEEPLREVCASVCPPGTFEDLAIPLLVNTVDVERGTRLMWGLPGLRDVPVVDAVYASCALPGFYPPGSVGGRACIDGGTIDNLPASIAALGADAVIAVDVGSFEVERPRNIATQGFAAIYMRAATLMMHALQQRPLADWNGPPMLLIRPSVGHHHWFSFSHGAEIVRAGYDAACTALDQVGDLLYSASGISPRRLVSVHVDRPKCIGCGICVALAPRLMTLDHEGKAVVSTTPVPWSPADGDFVQHCPTEAIAVQSLDGTLRTTRPMSEPTLDAADD
ncbi:MAG TPA: patatin-like phospholipase family protein [Gemmatimonadaceae bacterium]|jgi:NTE family protein